LAFGLEFALQLFDAGGELCDLVGLGGGLGPQAVDLPQQRVGPLGPFVGRMDEPSQRRPAQVRAVVDVAATKLVLRVENEVHRRLFRGKSDRCTNNTLLPGMAQ
jgi:hypothetical protein